MQSVSEREREDIQSNDGLLKNNIILLILKITLEVKIVEKYATHETTWWRLLTGHKRRKRESDLLQINNKHFGAAAILIIVGFARFVTESINEISFIIRPSFHIQECFIN